MKRSSGNYYLGKSKKFFEADGWTVQKCEVKYKVPGRSIWIKKDLFASDLLMMNGKEIIFVNVTVKGHVAEHIHRFEEYPFPDSVRRWVVYWDKGAKEPTIEEQKTEQK